MATQIYFFYYTRHWDSTTHSYHSATYVTTCTYQGCYKTFGNYQKPTADTQSWALNLSIYHIRHQDLAYRYHSLTAGHVDRPIERIIIWSRGIVTSTEISVNTSKVTSTLIVDPFLLNSPSELTSIPLHN